MSYIIETVTVYATVGEIHTIVCDEFGEYQPGSAV